MLPARGVRRRAWPTTTFTTSTTSTSILTLLLLLLLLTLPSICPAFLSPSPPHSRERALHAWQWPWGAPQSSKPSPTSTTSKKEGLKKAIIRATARTERGARANSTERTAILNEIIKLEALNAIKVPIDAPQTSGTWSILYRGPINQTDMESVERGYLYGPFVARLRSLVPEGAFQPKGLYQGVDRQTGSFRNVAEYVFLGKVPGTFAIDGVATPIPPRRFNVTFTTVQLSLGPLNLSFSLDAVKPGGWVDVTYLDDDFRVTRGDKGTIFVTARARST